MDENNPENVFNFISYLKREQYGDRPLFFGQNYNAKVIDQKEGAKTWAKVPGIDKYVEGPARIEPIYDPSKTTLFPRMWSNQQNHIAEYKKWAEIKGDKTPEQASMKMIKRPYEPTLFSDVINPSISDIWTGFQKTFS